MWSRIKDAVLGPVVERPAGLPESVDTTGVTFRCGRLVPRIGGLLGRMGGPAGAVTLGRTIVLHPDEPASPRLIVHELEHVRQWQDPWFPVRYTLETLRRGYRQNRYEVEAHRAADRAFPPHPPTREQP
ncbi:MAG TPA: DUF4157 domain-containing protein [Longimicrobium sp.]|nr:DUF4157 domain-containing protein [Longimicrobium sp.]